MEGAAFKLRLLRSYSYFTLGEDEHPVNERRTDKGTGTALKD